MALTRPRYSQIYDTDYKQSVRVATTADVGNLLATGNMTNSVDGVTLSQLDRILVKDQTDAKQNGIYSVLTLGTGSNGTWIRAKDANANDRMTAGMTTVVSEGAVNISKTFRLATPDPIVVGTTELSFVNPFAGGSAGGANTYVQFNDGGIAGGSANLTFNKSTNVLSVGGNINVTGSILPSANVTYDLGSPTQRWRDGWFSGTTIHIGTESMSVGTDGTWAFTSGNTTVELGAEAVFNPPSANISGNVSATNYLFANGTPLMSVVNTMISTANTGMQGHVAEQISTANVNLKGYVDAANTIQSNQIAGANSAITTANTNMKGYVDGEISTTTTAIATANTNLKGYTDNLVSTANVNLKGYVDGQISTTTSAVTTANTNLKGYVDGQITNLVGGSPATLDTLNEIAAALGNDANLSVTLTSLITGVQGNVTAANSAIATANTNMKGYTDNLVSTANVNLKGYVDGQISTTSSSITTANTNMKGYVDSANTIQSNQIAGANATMVTSVTGTAPVTSSGGKTPAISMAAATASVNGYMTSTYASKLDGIAAGATNVTNTNQLTNGAGFVTASVTLTTAAQTNITSVGTLTSLAVSGAITASASSSDAAVRITQAGSGHALLVEDSTSPDATPTVIDASGRLLVGAETVYTITGSTAKRVQSHSTGGDAGFSSAFWANSAAGTTQQLMKSRGTSVGDFTSVVSNDTVGTLMWGGADGTQFVQCASIYVVVDGSVTANSVPSQFRFATTAQGETSTTERLRISGNGILVTGNITGTGILTVNSGSAATAIVNGGTNGVGNIGASGQGFNTVFAKSTSAQYADLAEVYRSDRNYIPGTVVVFGGTSEVTVSLTSHDTTVAGVVSTNPAYLMNDREDGVAVALQGRVPCRVLGPVVKGDRVVTSDVRGVAERLDMTKYQPGCIIGKALGSVPDGEIATIEVVVGRN